MTDKEIIIDGVDVSECEKLGETIDGITCGLGKRIRFANKIITKHNLCKNNPNCYYKQRKRKEQECEELKKEINGYKTIIGKIRQEVQEDVTCESRECGCDSYEECIECLKNTILNIIDEERNDFVQGRVICKECGK